MPDKETKPVTPPGESAVEERSSGRLRRGLRWLIHPGSSLRSRTINAGVWALALNLSTRLLRTIRTIVLARLLAPEDFGLMGIALITLGLLDAFTRTGFDQALIQRKGDIRTHLNAAWTVAIFRGVVLGGILLLAAPLVAGFFDEPNATAILRVMAATVFVAGFKNVGVVYFDKELQFRERYLFRSVPHLIDLAVALTAAFVLKSVWALVLGVLAREISALVASYVAHPYRPQLDFDREKTLELFRFGIWIFGSSILTYATTNLDNIAVGRILDATELGFYTMAFTLATMVTRELTQVINVVAFPAYSKLQSDPIRLKNAYLRTLRVVALGTFPMAAGFWFVGDQAVEIFLGTKWSPMIPAFKILLIAGLVRAVSASAGPLFKGTGRPDLVSKLQLVIVTTLAILVFGFTSSFGIEGAAWATVIATSGPALVSLYVAARLVGARLRDLVTAIAVPAISATIMVSILLLLKAVLASDGPWLLAWAPPIGAGAYALCVVAARRYLGFAPEGYLAGAKG